MSIIDYITRCVSATKSNGASTGDYGKCLKSLQLFVADGKRDDIIMLANSDFVEGYCRFMYDGSYSSMSRGEVVESVSSRTSAKHVAALRTLARRAMADGLIPSIDRFPAALQVVAKQLPNAIATSERNYSPPKHDFIAEIARLTSAVAIDMADKHKARNARYGLLYLLSLYAYGAEVKEIIALKSETISVYSSTFKRQFDLPKFMLEAVDVHNGRLTDDGQLLRRPADFDDSSVEEKIAAYMKSRGISLYHSRSIMTDWLCAAVERGCSPSIVDAVTSGNIANLSDGLIETINRSIAADAPRLLRRWYVLCSYDASVRSDKLKQKVAAYASDNKLHISRTADLYDPQYIRKINLRGRMIKRNSPIVSRYLFVRATIDAAQRIDRMSSTASFMRVPGDKNRFATVNHEEILRLIAFLQDFRNDIEIVDMAEWARRKRVDLNEGTPVRILSGPLQGMTGTILSLKRSTAGRTEDYRVFTVAIATGLCAITATLTGLDLEPIIN